MMRSRRRIDRLRDRAAKDETVEGRPIADGDTAVLTIDRTDPDGKVDSTTTCRWSLARRAIRPASIRIWLG